MERERENPNGLCVLPHQMQSNRWNAFFIRDYGWSLFTHRLDGVVMCALALLCVCGFVASIWIVAISTDAQHFTILFWLSCYRRAGHFQTTFQYHHFNQYDMMNVINESEMNGAFCLSHSSRLLHTHTHDMPTLTHAHARTLVFVHIPCAKYALIIRKTVRLVWLYRSIDFKFARIYCSHWNLQRLGNNDRCDRVINEKFETNSNSLWVMNKQFSLFRAWERGGRGEIRYALLKSISCKIDERNEKIRWSEG